MLTRWLDILFLVFDQAFTHSTSRFCREKKNLLIKLSCEFICERIIKEHHSYVNALSRNRKLFGLVNSCFELYLNVLGFFLFFYWPLT